MGGVWRTAKRRKQTCVGAPTVETGVLFIGRGVEYRKTGLHGLLLIHRLLPRSSLHGLLIIHRRRAPASNSTVHPRHLPPASTSYCSSTGSSSSNLHRLLLNHPCMGYCSSSPPPATVQPALHGVLFTHPQPARSRSCSSSGNGLYYHVVLFIQPPLGTVHTTLNNTHCSSRGSKFDWL